MSFNQVSVKAGQNPVDDEVSTYKREIESLKLSEGRCIEVSKYGAGALEELQEGLEKLRYEEVVKVLEAI